MTNLEVEFKKAFGRKPEIQTTAGGRVNLIGEHTDYHEGYVFPAAIDLKTWALGACRADGVVRIRSLRTGGEASAVKDQLKPPGTGWKAYVLGPFWALREEGVQWQGADILIDSSVPFGGGLSSSASVQVALTGLGLALFQGVGADQVEAREVARLARKAENVYCGVPCGIMDQMASACGRAGHALLLDCRTLECSPVPVPTSFAFLVADSGVKHALGTSEYAKRQKECAAGLAALQKKDPSLQALRDVPIALLEESKRDLSDTIYRRLYHVVTENDRVLRAREALESRQGEALGKLLYASQESLARDYEVSCTELDLLVEIASSLPAVFGARLTGAGFGGNTINLVEADKAESCKAAIEEGYAVRTGRRTTVLKVSPSEGLTSRPL